MSIAVLLIALTVLWISRRINSRSDKVNVVADTALAMPPRVSAIIGQHCADCHSNVTRWPWYRHIPPVSWLLRRDIDHAKRVLNFSQPFAGQKDAAVAAAVLTTVCRMAESGGMPPLRYRLLHPNAALTTADQAEVCRWTEARSRYFGKLAEAKSHPDSQW